MDINAARPCPFCGKTRLKIEIKTQNTYKRQSGAVFRLHSGSVRCNCCHSRGPTASAYIPERHVGPIPEFEQEIIRKWNERN